MDNWILFSLGEVLSTMIASSNQLVIDKECHVKGK